MNGNEVACRFLESALQRGALPHIAGLAENANSTGGTLGNLICQRGAAIFGTVINDQDFLRDRTEIRGQHTFENGRDGSLLVVAGNDHRKFHGQSVAGLTENATAGRIRQGKIVLLTTLVNVTFGGFGMPLIMKNATALVDDMLKAFRNDERNRGLSLPDDDALRSVAEKLVTEMFLLERAVGNPDERIDVVWVLSGPGSWFKPAKNDRYALHPWARWMDRARIEVGVSLVRAVTAERLGYVTAHTVSDEQIKAHGPHLFYNGRLDEVEAFWRATTEPDFGIPQTIITAVSGFTCPDDGWQPIETTVDNVRAFRCPTADQPPRRIAVVSHPPQLVRFLHILNRWRTTPDQSMIQLFPVRTPMDGREEYIRHDVQSTLAHIFLAKDATTDPYPAVW